MKEGFGISRLPAYARRLLSALVICAAGATSSWAMSTDALVGVFDLCKMPYDGPEDATQAALEDGWEVAHGDMPAFVGHVEDRILISAAEGNRLRGIWSAHLKVPVSELKAKSTAEIVAEIYAERAKRKVQDFPKVETLVSRLLRRKNSPEILVRLAFEERPSYGWEQSCAAYSPYPLESLDPFETLSDLEGVSPYNGKTTTIKGELAAASGDQFDATTKVHVFLAPISSVSQELSLPIRTAVEIKTSLSISPPHELADEASK